MNDDVRRRRTLIALALFSVLAVAVSLGIDRNSSSSSKDGDTASATSTSTTRAPRRSGAYFTSGDTSVLADPKGFGKPYPDAQMEGILTFRGNPSRSYYGQGPVPADPKILHTFPDEPMCRQSENLGQVKVWCGMGWTGQPLIVERKDRRWAIFGGYDGHIHFMDAMTGQRILPDLETGDIIKGTPTMDPDGLPLVYSGSRDNYLRVIAIDRPGAAETLYKLDSESIKPTLWNDDWDSSPLVFGDYLVEGSESSRFWVIKLNKRIDKATGLVEVDPKVVFSTEAWDQDALDQDGDVDASVESSVAVYGNTVYFGTSAGLVLGYDLTGVDQGTRPKKVFRFFSGGDIDPSVVVDDKGFLYVAQEYDRPLARSREVGQLTKLDPRNTANPIVWKVDEAPGLKGGIYGTPGIHGNVVYAATNGGRLIAVDRTAGNIIWEKKLPPPTWGSPVIVDDTLLIGDCQGDFHAFDVSDPLRSPPEKWKIHLGGCIEATPAVWDGRIYIGTRAGHLYVLGEPGDTRTTRSGAGAGPTSTTGR
jgi:outer membrane protein assembly factor BamB